MKRHRNFAVVSQNQPDLEIWGARSSPGDRSVELQKKRPNILKALKRAQKCARLFDHLLCLLPFEPPYFEKVGLKCTWVGHPVVAETSIGNGAAFREKYQLASGTPLFTLLPGSRKGEVDRHMPIFAQAITLLSQQIPDFAIAVAVPKNVMSFIAPYFQNCPFRAIDGEIEACGLKRGADAILIDFHAEATSEKQALGYFVDGRASAVIGTHTHVPTADEQVLNGGTAYISDVGMCGDYDSVLGMNKEEPLSRFLTKIPRGRFEPATGPATISGLAVDIDDATGLVRHTAGLRLGGVLAPTEPRFWVES